MDVMDIPMGKSFASDNNSGIHPEVLSALAYANIGHTVGYGDDPYTAEAIRKMQAHFGISAIFFVFTGTAANVLGLKTVMQSHQAVICARSAHLNMDECGAPEHFIGCKLLTIPTDNGKITVDQIQAQLQGRNDQHRVQPRVVSLTQPTELGTLYQPHEIRAITDFAHAQNLLVHVDGARLCNATAALGLGLGEATRDLGIDLLSFGGTKNGLMAAEAIIFFNPTVAADFLYIRKQGLQLASKMRFVAAQFDAYFTDDLWLTNARQANQMAQKLAIALQDIPQIQLIQPVETNALFVRMPRACIPLLQKQYYFYVWNEERDEVRWMTSFDTTDTDIEQFVAALRKVLAT